jgi:hypothetical protein
VGIEVEEEEKVKLHYLQPEFVFLSNGHSLS